MLSANNTDNDTAINNDLLCSIIGLTLNKPRLLGIGSAKNKNLIVTNCFQAKVVFSLYWNTLFINGKAIALLKCSNLFSWITYPYCGR